MTPVSPYAEILVTHDELGPDIIRLLVQALDESFLARGHQGEELGMTEKAELRRGPWSLQRVPTDVLVPTKKHRALLVWLEEEEADEESDDEWDDEFADEEKLEWPIVQPGQADPENPIIVGPRWALSNSTGMLNHVILDGWHRVATAIRAGIPVMDVFVIEGE